MSSEQPADKSSQRTAPHSPITTDTSTTTTYPQSSTGTAALHPTSATPLTGGQTDETQERKQGEGHLDQKSETTSPSTPDDPRVRPRQVIAVSASKGPAAFFNLARKFLVTDEICDLSALEGAIVSAADAAHLLERSKLATIVRVQTSYVTVEPKRRRQESTRSSPSETGTSGMVAAAAPAPVEASTAAETSQGRPSSTRELRRARIVITVKRTESYRQWLIDNPLQAVIAGDDDDENEAEEDEVVAVTQQDL